MNMFMGKLFRRTRQFHTIISQETIKPSSPTPFHLKTHTLSLLDHFAPNFLMPKVFFYKKYNNDNTNNLKLSLSQSLTQYYPFAGRFPASSKPNYINCNDEGIEFTEAYNDSRIDDFIHNRNQDETFDRLIPDGKINPQSLVKVQLNHLAGGGAALAVSVSHKVADGFTAARFIDHWATVARGQTPINPDFVSSTGNTDVIKIPEAINKGTDKGNYVSKRFVFSNSKLKELKEKVMMMGTNPLKPSRVELLTSLLFKCILDATKTKTGDFESAKLLHTVNMRNMLIKKSPETAAGNIMTILSARISSSEIEVCEVIEELRKEKMKLEGIRDEEEACKQFLETLKTLGEKGSRSVISSSLCRFPFYKVDFGWGNPVKVATRYPDVDDNGVILLDTPEGDGIEALVHLQKEQMPLFEKNEEELLAYV